MKRPDTNTPEALTLIAKELLPRIMEWFGADAQYQDDKEIIEDIAMAIHYDQDGYNIAKQLDRKGWEPDSTFVDILDNVWPIRSKVRANLEREWVKYMLMMGQITTPPVRAKVKFQHFKGHSKPQEEVEGEVLENKDTGHSVVFCPALGHFRKDAMPVNGGSMGLYVAWEQLTII